MTRIRLLVVLLPLLAVAQQQNDDKSMILALESAWNQAEIHHDTNAAAALMADTFISVDHHGKLLSRSQYLADLKDPSYNPEEISNSETSVYIYGDTAIVSSAYRTKGTDNGKPFQHHGRFTNTWIRRNGKWQCIADHETLIN
ncbi:MAG: nuclear transport factor 2 family protein [Acidobacteriia bacterium]|nr:nuclear transport factor 2 family protein [Terriglobia bacterium]